MFSGRSFVHHRDKSKASEIEDESGSVNTTQAWTVFDKKTFNSRAKKTWFVGLCLSPFLLQSLSQE